MRKVPGRPCPGDGRCASEAAEELALSCPRRPRSRRPAGGRSKKAQTRSAQTCGVGDARPSSGPGTELCRRRPGTGRTLGVDEHIVTPAKGAGSHPGTALRVASRRGRSAACGHGSSRGSRLARPHGPAWPHRSRLCREPLRQREERLEQPREGAPALAECGRPDGVGRGGHDGRALSVVPQTRETASGLCLRDSAGWQGWGRCSGLKRNRGKSLR